MALTERLAILIDAKSGGAVTEFKKAAKATDDLGDSAKKTGGLINRASDTFGVSASALKTGIATAAVAAGGALVKFGVDAANAASDLNEQISNTQITFGSASKSVIDFAGTAATSLGLSKTEALEAANVFGAFFTNVGIGEKASAQLSTGLVQLSGDIASFKNVAGGAAEVADALRSGLSGESEPLRKFGIFLDEGKTKAKAMELGLADAHGELSDGAKIVARYSLILDQSGKAQGDFARTSNSLANQQRILAAQTENLKAGIGSLVAPLATSLVGALVSVTAPLQNVSASTDEFSNKVAKLNSTGAYAAVPLLQLVGAYKALTDSTEDAGTKTDQFQDAIRRYAAIAGNAKSSTGALAAAKRDLQAAAKAAKSEQDSLNGALVTDEDKAKKAADAHKNLKTTLLSAVEAERAHASALVAVQTAQLNVTAKQSALNDLLRKGAVDLKEVEAATARLVAANKGLAAAQQRAADARKALDDVLAGPSARTMNDAILDTREATLGVADAQANLVDAQKAVNDAQEQGDPIALAAANRNLERATIDLTRAQQRETDAKRAQNDLNPNSEAGALRVRDAFIALVAANEDVDQANRDVRSSQVELNKAREGDPEFTAKVTAARLDLAGASANLNDAQFNASKSAIAFRDNLAASRQALIDNRQAAAEVRFELGALQAMPIMQQILNGGRLPTATTFLSSGAPLNAPSSHAMGGPVSAGELSWVGEKGPELVRFGSSGTVIPNSALGGTTEITINMPPGSDGDDVVAALTRWSRSNGPIPIATRG